MLRLHDCAASANGYKVRLLLAQLRRPYELVEVDIFRGESRTPAFLEGNPSGQIPVLQLEGGQWLPESNAILFYLAQGTVLLSDDPAIRARTLGWMFFEQNAVEPKLGSARFWILSGRDKGREAALAYLKEAGKGALETMERHLQRYSFFVEEHYSVADIALYAYSHLAPEAGVSLGPFPAVRAWIARVEAQPDFFPGPAPYPANARVDL
ncbi:glutathione S-transferase family protein [Aggregicoccus sp. 17bor-14]|uniref:glutathione S-transferase family protein n=1 Tax=Myxococcaceae TaxID=31 RepID=UPI00129D07B7|nr:MULTISPECIES: glutathione S-transferase family protein [Myxococcaceae]MBF5045423.1 glutathione S-transferase family protein [Simulacricoccus sp. 17bor-14]MRI91164.1 glutathione S-transferase family protein [Aggregicoccus sp. 17bor-14]